MNYVLIIGTIHLVTLFILCLRISMLLFKNKTDAIITTLIFTWTNLIITALFLSLFSAISNYWLYATVSIVQAIAVFYIATRTGVKPFDMSNRLPYKKNSIFDRIIIATLVLLFLFNAIAAFSFIPNNWDSLTYHLPRIYFYHSQGHLGHFFTNNMRQIYFPFNATLLQMPVVQYGFPNSFFNIINLSAWCIIGLAIYRISLFLSSNRTAALLSAFFALTATSVLAQATTTNNDILLGVTVIVALYFLFLWAKYQKGLLLVLFMISIGIAIGLKVTIAYFVPGFFIYLFVWAFIIDKKKSYIKYVAVFRKKYFYSAFALMVLLAAPSYIINLYKAKHISAPDQAKYINMPFSVRASYQNLSGLALQASLSPPIALSYNLFTLYDAYANTAYKHTAAFYLNKSLNKYYINHWDKNLAIGSQLFYDNFISQNLVEDEVWYGLGTYLVIIAFLFVLFAKNTQPEIRHYSLFLFLLVLSFFLLYGVYMKWQPWSCRFFNAAWLLSVPAVGILWTRFQSSPTLRIIIYGISFLILFNAFSYIFNNQRRPLLEILSETEVINNKMDFSTLAQYDSLYIVFPKPIGNDLRIYELLRHGNRQYVEQTPAIKSNAYNIVALQDSLEIDAFAPVNKTKHQTEYIGFYQLHWFGINNK